MGRRVGTGGPRGAGAGAAVVRPPFERPWMMDMVDRPLVVDNEYTRRRLDWDVTPELTLTRRLPVLVRRFHADRAAWEARNRRRNELRYEYEPDDPAAKV